MKFGSSEAYWKDLGLRVGAIGDGTDYGYCCLITPQISLREK